MRMEANIESYREGLEGLKEMRSRCIDKRDLTLINGMISDVEYALTWLETGRRPGNKRGVERLAAYQRDIPTDLIEKYMQPTPQLEVRDYTFEEVMQAEYIVAMLSDQERVCFEMHYIGMYSLEDIAKELRMAKGTAQTYLKRANNKVKMYKSRPLQRILDIVV